MKINILLIALVLFGLTFLIIPNEKSNINRFQIDKHPQEYMSHIFIQNYTQDGQLKTQISASYWAYAPEAEASNFSKPHISAYRTDGSEWHIRADVGQTKQPKIGNVEEIELFQNVTIERPATAKLEPIKVITEKLCYQPKNEYAESDAFIKMMKPGLSISGIGLRAYINKNLVQLLDNVETYYKASAHKPNESITIRAKQVEFDEKEDKAIYRKQVVMTQGGSQLNSDILVIARDKSGKIDSMMATGNPAYFKSDTNTDKSASGHANLVNYYPKQNKIHLSHNAELMQNNNVIRSGQFSYDLNTEVLASEPGKGQRTTIILQPKETKEQNTS